MTQNYNSLAYKIALDRILHILGDCTARDENMILYDNVFVSNFEKLITENLARIEDALDGAPTNGEFLYLAQRFPEVKLQCLIFTPRDSEPKVYINAAGATGKLSTEFIIEFAILMRKANVFKLGTKKVFAQFFIKG